MFYYFNGSYGREVTLFGLTIFWRHKHVKPIPGATYRFGRMTWERY